MTFVRDILLAKGHDVWSISAEWSVYDALKLMADKDVGALLVLEGTKPVGIFSERDYARKIILHGRFSKETRVREIMTVDVLSVRLDQTIEECMALMTEKRIRHLPVCEDDQLRGIVSIGDVVRDVIAGKDFTIKQLEQYITGAGI